LLGRDFNREAGREAGTDDGAGGGLEFAGDDIKGRGRRIRVVEAGLAGGGGADGEEVLAGLKDGEPGFERPGGLAVDEGEDERRGGFGGRGGQRSRGREIAEGMKGCGGEASAREGAGEGFGGRDVGDDVAEVEDQGRVGGEERGELGLGGGEVIDTQVGELVGEFEGQGRAAGVAGVGREGRGGEHAARVQDGEAGELEVGIRVRGEAGKEGGVDVRGQGEEGGGEE